MPRTLPDYDELEIRLTPGRGDAYNVEIASASGARGDGHFAAPAELDVARFRLTVDPRNRRIRGSSPYLKAAQQFGGGLFAALVADPKVRDVYTGARHDASAAGRGLRVTLSLGAAPELAGIPWEFLYDQPRFLANHVNSPVVRLVDLEDPPSPLRVQAPLRILGMVSRPQDDALAILDAEDEQAALEHRLDPLIDAGRVTLRWLERATLSTLQQEVDHGEDFHIFHYIGHGEYDEDNGESSLILEHADRRAHRVGGQQLGEILCDRGSLRLAVLNACETAQTARQDPLAGIATSLMEYDVPAVVAMQFAITDEGALIFADEFYRALAEGDAVDAAVTQARRALASRGDEIEWGTPVLFMRVADGLIFDVTAEPTAPESAIAIAPAGHSRGCPIDVSALVSILAPCLTALLGVSGATTREAVGSELRDPARRVWAELGPHVESKPGALEAAKDVGRAPQDRHARAALELQLEELLSDRPALAAQIAPMMMDSAQAAVASGARSVTVGGSVTGSVIVTGDSAVIRE